MNVRVESTPAGDRAIIYDGPRVYVYSRAEGIKSGQGVNLSMWLQPGMREIREFSWPEQHPFSELVERLNQVYRSEAGLPI